MPTLCLQNPESKGPRLGSRGELVIGRMLGTLEKALTFKRLRTECGSVFSEESLL